MPHLSAPPKLLVYTASFIAIVIFYTLTAPAVHLWAWHRYDPGPLIIVGAPPHKVTTGEKAARLYYAPMKWLRHNYPSIDLPLCYYDAWLYPELRTTDSIE